jgi:PPM family protein phosphatase
MQANFYDGSIIGRREDQQDDKANLILADGYRLYVLADGMGGQKAGRVASRSVCASFREFFQDRRIDEPQEALQQAMEFANSALANLLREQPGLGGMGTTLLAVLIDETSNTFSFISVGDSPLYCLRDHRLTRINANHSFAETLRKMVQAGEMTEEEAAEHPDRHAITSALMGKDIEQVDLQSDQLAPGELLLMASDGVQTLSDNTGGEIETILKREAADLEKAVGCLLTAIEERDNEFQDNATVILIQPAAQGRQMHAKNASREVKTPPTLRLGPKTTHSKVKPLFFALALVLIAALLAAATWHFLFRDSPQEDATDVSTHEIIDGATDAAIEGTIVAPDDGLQPGGEDHLGPEPQPFTDTPDESSEISTPETEVQPEAEDDPLAENAPKQNE